MKLVQKSSRSKNRRVSKVRHRRQQHLLDVKVRSRRVTQHRIRRALGVLSRVVLVAGLCSAVYVGAREGARRLFFENSDYQVKQQLPQVDEVQVVRKLPGEIDIRVVERKPVAWITSNKEISDPFVSDAAFLVDARGVLMRQKKLLPEYLGLPLILGCSSESLEAGKVVESPEAKTALDLLRLSTRSFMQTRFQIREIDVSRSYCLLVTDKNHTRVTFGLNDLETQLQRLEQFLVYCDDSKQELETVNLIVQRNIPVTFATPPAAVINDTIDPLVEPRVLKAIPVHSAKTAAPPSKAHASSTPIAKVIPVKRQRKD